MTEIEIEQAIRTAFKFTPVPPEGNLYRADAVGRYANPSGDRLKGRTWEEVVELKQVLDPIWLLTPEAFRYYIPAYVLNEYRRRAQPHSRPMSVYHLLLAPNERDSFIAENLGRLTTEEYLALRHVVFREMESGDDEAESAWELGWKTPENPWAQNLS